MADGEFARLLFGAESEVEPSISSHGGWFAYTNNTASQANPEINIRPFPDAARTRIPVGPGQQPVFSRDGSELFYFDGKGLVAAPIAYEPTLSVGPPRRLFESDAYLWAALGRAWDVDPSGERFLMIRAPAQAAGAEPASLRVDVVVNWVEELKSRVPTE